MRLGESVWVLVAKGHSREEIQHQQEAHLLKGMSLFDYATWEYLFGSGRLPAPKSVEGGGVVLAKQPVRVRKRPRIEMTDAVRAAVVNKCYIYNRDFVIEEAIMEIAPRARRCLLLACSDWGDVRIAKEVGCSVEAVERSIRLAKRALAWRQTGATKEDIERVYGMEVGDFQLRATKAPIKVVICSVLRKARGLPIEDIARMLNLSKSSVINYSNKMNEVLAHGT